MDEILDEDNNINIETARAKSKNLISKLLTLYIIKITFIKL